MLYNNGYNQDWSTLKKLVWLRGNPATGQIGTDLTVSGTPPLSLPNSLGKPLKAWSVDLLPYQEGSGDPAPDNVRPIHGTDKLTIYTDSKYGGLIDWNQQLFFDSDSWLIKGMRCNVNNGRFTIIGTPTATGTTALVPTRIYNKTKPIQGHVYALIVSGETNLNNFRFSIYGTPNQTVNLNPLQSVIFTCNSANVTDAEFVAQYNSGEEYNTDITAYLCDLTQMFGAGNEPSTIADFLAMFEKPYYPYSTGGTLMTVDQVNGAQYSPAVLTLPQTVYTGTIGSDGGESRWGEVDLGTLDWSASTPVNHVFRSDSLRGIIVPTSSGLDVTSAICEQFSAMGYTPISASDNGKFAVADNYSVGGRLVIIDHRWDSIDDFVTAVSGVKLVFPLINPTTFPLTSPAIPTPTGTAITWATAEDGTVDGMEVTYVGKA